ncbi:MAG TPA: hypothetical protein VFP63_01455 [Dehalococcoidia bacterium]|nr:hypothetical protein [Dehalococcoidia bacterium]
MPDDPIRARAFAHPEPVEGARALGRHRAPSPLAPSQRERDNA